MDLFDKIKNIAPSKLRLTIFLFFVGIISPCSIWANDFAPPCDTIILVSGNIIIANIQNENNTGINYNPCNETIEETLTWNQIKDINRWINPEIAKRKAKKVAIQEAKEEMSQKEKIKEAYTNTKETHAQKLRSTQEEMRRRHKLKQKRQAIKKETLKGINWRFSMSSGMVNFTQLSTIDIAFARQGFSTNKTGWFTLYNRIPRYDLFTAVHIDRKIVSNLFVGLKTSFLSQYVYAYKESDYRIDSPSHLIQTSIDYWDISSKVEWVSREHSFAFYGGSSLVLITDRRFKSTTSLCRNQLLQLYY